MNHQDPLKGPEAFVPCLADCTLLHIFAGVVIGKDVLSLKPPEVQRTFNVNIISQFTLIQSFLPAMIEQRSGVIVTMASVMGLLGT